MSNKSDTNSTLSSILKQLQKEFGDLTGSSATQTRLVKKANNSFEARQLSPRTVEKWFSGDIKYPRDWCGLLMILAVLGADRHQADEALLAAGLDETIEEIIPKTAQEQRVLDHWRRPLPTVEETGRKPDLIDYLSEESLLLPISDLPPHSRLYGFHQNPQFVGRESELAAMLEHLRRYRGILISGMSGVGKTQLAVEFAYRYASYFTGGIFFINCADPKAVDREIAACGGIHGMQLSAHYEEWQLSEQVATVKQAWKENVPRLLILDNVEASPQINVEQWLADELIPQSGGSRVIITTNKDTWSLPLLLWQVKLDPLAKEESIQMLQTQAPHLTEIAAGQIADALGYLPLALYGAGCYLRQYHFSVSHKSYLSLLNEAGTLVPDGHYHQSISPTRHELNVERTFSLNYQKLDPELANDRLARQLLGCLIDLAPGDPVPFSLLAVYFSRDEFGADTVRLEDALQRLSDLGLVQIAAGVITIHRLLLRFLKTRLESPPYLYTALADVVAEMSGAYLEVDTLWLPHVCHLAERICIEKTDEAAILASKFGTFLADVRDTTNGRAALEWALQVQLHSTKTKSLDLAFTHHQLGRIYSSAGDLDTARTHYEAALAIRQHSSQVNDNDLVLTLNNLGYIAMRSGDLDTAHQYLSESLKIREKLSVNAGIVKNNLGLLTFLEAAPNDLVALSSALADLQQGLELKINNPRGTSSHSFAYSYARIGVVQYAMGEIALGEQTLNTAVRYFKEGFRENSFGPGHELYSFALLLKTHRKFDSARLCARRAETLLAEATGDEAEKHLQLTRQLLDELPA